MKLKSFAFAEIFEDILFNSERPLSPGTSLQGIFFYLKRGGLPQRNYGMAKAKALQLLCVLSAPCKTAKSAQGISQVQYEGNINAVDFRNSLIGSYCRW